MSFLWHSIRSHMPSWTITCCLKAMNKKSPSHEVTRLAKGWYEYWPFLPISPFHPPPLFVTPLPNPPPRHERSK